MWLTHNCYLHVTVSGGPVEKAVLLFENRVILSEAKNPVRFYAKLTGFFVASLLRMTETRGHLNCNTYTEYL